MKNRLFLIVGLLGVVAVGIAGYIGHKHPHGYRGQILCHYLQEPASIIHNADGSVTISCTLDNFHDGYMVWREANGTYSCEQIKKGRLCEIDRWSEGQ